MKVVKAILTTLVVAAIAAGAYYAMQMTQQKQVASGGRGRAGGGGPVSVVVARARIADVPVYLEGVGSAKARNTITVKPQVDGRLISIKFIEGQDVKKGDLLAQIDPVTYQAQLDQALAKKSLDEALLANTRLDLVRFEKVGPQGIPQQQIDTQKALALQQEAQIKSDVAAIENLTAILGYTNITSPIDGRVGIRNLDEGNLVHASDPTGLVTITEVRPISVIFTIPQQQLPVLSKALSNEALKVETYTTDSRVLLDTGTLQVVDNQVDPQTGTIRIKADFPNEKLQLWPGQFVNVRLLVNTLKGAIVAPTAAVQRGPSGSYVYVVGADDAVAMRPVTVTQQDEKDAVIADGLSVGDKVVTSGFGRLEDGAKVKISAPDATEPQNPSNEIQKGAKSDTGAANLVPVSEAAAPVDALTTKTDVKSDTEPAPDTTHSRHRNRKDNGQGTTSSGAPQ